MEKTVETGSHLNIPFQLNRINFLSGVFSVDIEHIE